VSGGLKQQAADVWQAGLEVALTARSLVVLLGATDTGKTTMAVRLAREAMERGLRVGVIDADVGQSEIGPPGTVGLALPDIPAASASDWRPSALAFVGATTPVGRMLDVVVGARRMADEARRRGAEIIIVDTSGLVRGAVALRLKLAKLEVLQPSTILALRRGRELDPVLRLVPAACRAGLVTLPVPETVRPKPPGLRRARRAAHFLQYLKEARLHEIDTQRVLTADGWLFTGRPLAPGVLKAAAAGLGLEVLHGEQTPDGIHLVTRGAASRGRRAILPDLFGSRRITCTPATVFQNLLVGLLEEGGRLAEIGILQNVDFARGLLRVLSPLRSEGALRVLRYGRLRLRPDGTEIGPVRPGDL
jgi:polynucleotide 5'-hydroxyl-kinase GRC3/NOL9